MQNADLENNIISIPLTQDKLALIDAADADIVIAHKWHAWYSGWGWYARARINRNIIFLHQLLCSSDTYVDHINGNGLDNRRNNLRAATNQQNQANRGLSKANTSGYKGVSWSEDKQRWRASITFDYVSRHLGYFDTKEEAAKAYNTAAKSYFGEFAKMNLIKPRPPTINDLPPYLVSVIAEADRKGTLCPPAELMFKAFEVTDIDEVKVVILGQDSYHTNGKANGLAFGYHRDYTGPLDASLFNIIKEVFHSTGERVTDFTLHSWASQGVLLLNTRLTTEIGQALGHRKLGYEEFISSYLTELSQYHKHLVFMLWGKEAQSFDDAIVSNGHLILKASHPSPFSADLGFNGCGHFRTANMFLADHGKQPIRWGE